MKYRFSAVASQRGYSTSVIATGYRFKSKLAVAFLLCVGGFVGALLFMIMLGQGWLSWVL
ncbi:MAG: hypothetical protein V4440_04460 [Pseudomonadota bacterium]